MYTVLSTENLDDIPLLDLRTSLVLVILGLTICGLLIWNVLDLPV